MDKHPTCHEEGCQLSAAKGYRDCAQASGACDLLRSLPVSEGLEPRAELGAGLCCGAVVAIQLGRSAPKACDFVSGVVELGATSTPLGLVHRC